MSKNTRFFAILVALAIVCLAMPGMAATYFVDGGATGVGTGNDWTNAFTTLGPAVAAANASAGADKIWMKTGLYDVTNPAGVAQTTATLVTEDLSIYGGCAGTEGSQAAVDALTSTSRSTVAHLATTMDFTTVTMASRTGTQGLFNLAPLVNMTFDQVNLTSGVARVEVTGAGTFGFPTANQIGRVGGAIAGYGSNNVSLTECNVTKNFAVGAAAGTEFYGGPITLKKSHTGTTATLLSASLTMTNCLISDNSVVAAAALGSSGGGAILVEGNVIVQGCTFTNNVGGSRTNASRSRSASVLTCLPPSTSFTLSNSTFSNNGGAKHVVRFAMDAQETPSITNCVFSGNDAGEAGALAINGAYSGTTTWLSGTGIGNTRVIMNLAVTNCSFTNNVAFGGEGGVIRKFQGKVGSTATFANCSFTNNTATNNAGGVIAWKEYFGFTLDKCTFTGNRSGLTSASNANGAGVIATESFSGDTLTSYVPGPVFEAKNCLFKNNASVGTQIRAAVWDSGKTADQTRGTLTKLVNCTFIGNSQSLAAPVVEVKRSRFNRMHVVNCVFAGNPVGIKMPVRASDSAWLWVNNSATDITTMTSKNLATPETNIALANNVTGLLGIDKTTGLIKGTFSQAVDAGTDTGDTTVTIPTADMLGTARVDAPGVGTSLTDMGAFELTSFGYAVSTLGYNPSTAAFGTVNKNTNPMTTQTLTVGNAASSAGSVTISLGAIEGANASEYSASIIGSTTLAPGATSTIQIVWTSTARPNGDRSLFLPLIHTADNLVSPMMIPITGTLVPVEMSVIQVD